MKKLYYTPSGNRVKINKVHSSGLCEVRNREAVQSLEYIGDLKRVQ